MHQITSQFCVIVSWWSGAAKWQRGRGDGGNSEREKTTQRNDIKWKNDTIHDVNALVNQIRGEWKIIFQTRSLLSLSFPPIIIVTYACVFLNSTAFWDMTWKRHSHTHINSISLIKQYTLKSIYNIDIHPLHIYNAWKK